MNEIDRLTDALLHIWALHNPARDTDGRPRFGVNYNLHPRVYERVCATCGEPEEYATPWPCETARIAAEALRIPIDTNL